MLYMPDSFVNMPNKIVEREKQMAGASYTLLVGVWKPIKKLEMQFSEDEYLHSLSVFTIFI